MTKKIQNTPKKEQQHHTPKHEATIDISSSNIELQKLTPETDQTIKAVTEEVDQKEETNDSKYLLIALSILMTSSIVIMAPNNQLSM